MEVTLEKNGPCEALVRFNVPAKEFAAQTQAALSQATRQVRVKGFRPGKAPTRLLERSYGDAARKEAKEHFLRKAYQQVLEDNALKPAAHPQVDVDELQLSESGELSHSFRVHLRPQFELCEYKGLEVDAAPLEVDDDEVESALDDVRRQRATPEPVGDEGLPEDGVALCKVTLRSGDEDVLVREGLRLSPKLPFTGADPEVFLKALSGARAGDERELPFDFPSDHERVDLRGTRGVCRLSIGQAFRVVRPTEEELFELFQVTDTQALRETVKERIRSAKQDQDRFRIEGELLDQLIEMHPMDLPEGLVQEQANARLRSLRADLERQGSAPEAIEQQVEAQAQAAYETATKSMRALFLIESISEREGLAVKQEDIVAELQQIAGRNNAPLEEVLGYYRDQNLFGQLAMELLERKVRTFLREAAAVRGA